MQRRGDRSPQQPGTGDTFRTTTAKITEPCYYYVGELELVAAVGDAGRALSEGVGSSSWLVGQGTLMAKFKVWVGWRS